jgi:hypothetical protein
MQADLVRFRMRPDGQAGDGNWLRQSHLLAKRNHNHGKTSQTRRTTLGEVRPDKDRVLCQLQEREAVNIGASGTLGLEAVRQLQVSDKVNIGLDRRVAQKATVQGQKKAVSARVLIGGKN